MWDRPFTFILLNLVAYIPTTLFLGFRASPAITIVISLFIIFYNAKIIGWQNSFFLSIFYLLVFDSPSYTFTFLQLRLWYLPLVMLLFLSMLSVLVKRKIKIDRNSIFYLAPISILFLVSLYYLFTEDVFTKLHIVKYWLFSVTLIVILNIFLKRQIASLRQILHFIFSIIIFVSLYGLVQYFFNSIGNFNLINTPGHIRPEAFFSETTWYAEFLILGFIITPLLSKSTGNRYYLLWLIIFFIGLWLSNTRNAFLGLIVFGLFESLWFLLLIAHRKNLTINVNFFVTLVALFFLFVLFSVTNFDLVKDQAIAIVNRFDIENDASGRGRIEAFKVSLDMARDTPFFGNGFYWDKTISVGEGFTSVGAKSFNLLFMMYHIFGPFGFVFFLSMVITYFCELLLATVVSKDIYARYGLCVFFIFFLMSMFAPIHQFPVGLLFISISVFLVNVSRYERGLLYYS